MFSQPATIALLLVSALSALALLSAAPFAFRIIKRWDIRSGSALQLVMERQTYLFSVLLSFVMVLQLASVLLFVFNAEKMSDLFVGAMCAVGTLNVNAYGFPTLIAKIALFFLAAMWLAINHIDNQARDYPLVRIKYSLLLAGVPLALALAWMEWQYFFHLKADIITSCCGSLFSEGRNTVAAEVSAMAPRPAMIVLIAGLAAAVASATWHGTCGSRASGYVLALASLSAFVCSLTGILAFISLYVYEHPHHHCPFCILKPEYDYRGYALYLPLFFATAAGLAAGAVQPFARIASLRAIAPVFSRRMALCAAWGFVGFAAIAGLMIRQSHLILLEY